MAAATAKGTPPAPSITPAEHDPVARVVLAASLPHLDRIFDYLVPLNLADEAVVGSRVAVRFGGRDTEGFIVARAGTSERDGRLVPIRRVLTPFAVLTPATLRLAENIAADFAGGVSDVLRFAVPPRHVATEKPYREVLSVPDAAASSSAPDKNSTPHDATRDDWGSYRGGRAFVSRVLAGEAPRAVWTALAGVGEKGWAHQLASLALAVADEGRSAILVLPDGHDVEAVMDRLELAHPGVSAAPEPLAVRYTHDLGVGPRYGAFLAALSGRARIVVGTRPAAYIPVPQPGLLVCWDDADSSHAEPRAPYAGSLDVLTHRSGLEDVALLVGSTGRSVKAQALLASGWARPVTAERETVRRRSARVEVAGGEQALERDPGARTRIPVLALAAARVGLGDGLPVLVQVPRLGYQPGLACQQCRRPARCGHCHGPLRRDAAETPVSCTWCARPALTWQCPHCHGTALRSTTVGVHRTAEELGRTFPQTPVVTSWSEHRLRTVDATPALVLATPGAEPTCPAGYGAALLLDAESLLSRPRLDADEDALRRWSAAAVLVRPSDEGGRVVLSTDPGLAPVQALVRHDAPWLAARLWEERVELRLPPAAVFASVTGEATLVSSWARELDLPSDTVSLGPTPVPPRARDRPAGHATLDVGGDVRLILSLPAERRRELATVLRAAVVKASLERRPIPRVQIGVDPDG